MTEEVLTGKVTFFAVFAPLKFQSQIFFSKLPSSKFTSMCIQNLIVLLSPAHPLFVIKRHGRHPQIFLLSTAVSADILSIICKSTSLVQWRNASSLAGTQQFLGALVFSLNQIFLFFPLT